MCSASDASPSRPRSGEALLHCFVLVWASASGLRHRLGHHRWEPGDAFLDPGAEAAEGAQALKGCLRHRN